MKKLSLLPILVATIACNLSASSIVIGGSLLSTAGANQLATWLGEGDLKFTDIYTAQAGDTESNFHGAVDGMGRTFTLISARAVNSSGAFSLLGGYDPLSWDSSSNYHYSPTDSQRTAFIFNLSTNFLQRQNLINQPSGSDTGQYQTYNTGSAGPAFGGGHDLVTGAGASTLLGATTTAAYRYVYNYSYGATGTPGGTNLLGTTGLTLLEVAGVETYTITSTATPEPGTAALFGASLVYFLASRLRRRQ